MTNRKKIRLKSGFSLFRRNDKGKIGIKIIHHQTNYRFSNV